MKHTKRGSSSRRYWRGLALGVWGLLIGFLVLFATGQQVSAATQAPLQTAIERNGQKHGYDLILKNNTNRLYRNVKVQLNLPKQLGGSQGVMAWQLKTFGAAGQHRLKFTVNPKNRRLVIKGHDASIQYPHTFPWVWVVGGVIVLAGLAGAVLVFRRHKAVAIILIAGAVGGGTALVATQPTQAATKVADQINLVVGGQIYPLKVTIAYTKVSREKLVPFALRLNGQANRVTMVDQKTRVKQAVPVRHHVAELRLIQTHHYQVQASGVKATLIPAGGGYRVKATRGQVQSGAILTGAGGQAQLTAATKVLGANGESYQLHPASAQVVVNNTTSDYRVGDRLYVPAFGVDFGGAAAQVIQVALKRKATVLTLRPVASQRILSAVKSDQTTVAVDLTKGVFIPAAGVKAAGSTVATAASQTSLFKADHHAQAVTASGFTLTPAASQKQTAVAGATVQSKGTLAVGVDLQFGAQAKLKSRLEANLNLSGDLQVKANADTASKPVVLGTLHFPTTIPTVSVVAPLTAVTTATGRTDLKLAFALGTNATGGLSDQGQLALTADPTMTATTAGDVAGTAQVKLGTALTPTVLQDVSLFKVNVAAGPRLSANGSFKVAGTKVTAANAKAAKLKVNGAVGATATATTTLPQLLHLAPAKPVDLAFTLSKFSYTPITTTTSTAPKLSALQMGMLAYIAPETNGATTWTPAMVKDGITGLSDVPIYYWADGKGHGGLSLGTTYTQHGDQLTLKTYLGQTSTVSLKQVAAVAFHGPYADDVNGVMQLLQPQSAQN